MHNPRTLTRSHPRRKLNRARAIAFSTISLIAIALSTQPIVVRGELTERLRESKAELERLDGAAATIQGRLSALKAREKALKAELADRVARRQALTAESEQRVSQLRSDLVASYPLLRNDARKLLLSPLAPNDVERAERYLGYLTRQRLKQIERTNKTLAELAKVEAALGDSLHALVALTRAIRDEELNLAAQKSAAVETLRRVERQSNLEARASERARRRAEIAALVSRAKAMDAQPARPQTPAEETRSRRDVTPDQTSPSANAPKAPSERKPNQHRDRTTKPETRAVSRNILALKGQLDWPVQGKLRRSIRNAPLRYRKGGVWLLGKSNAPVRAIAAGTVAFADEFRGLGRLIILDHGKGGLELVRRKRQVAEATR